MRTAEANPVTRYRGYGDHLVAADPVIQHRKESQGETLASMGMLRRGQGTAVPIAASAATVSYAALHRVRHRAWCDVCQRRRTQIIMDFGCGWGPWLKRVCRPCIRKSPRLEHLLRLDKKGIRCYTEYLGPYSDVFYPGGLKVGFEYA